MIFSGKVLVTLHVLVSIIVASNCQDDSPLNSNRPYFCSTCFTNIQHQNYHCCFYFFKCCAEARRGLRSTTPDPEYPGIQNEGQVQEGCYRNCKSGDTSKSASESPKSGHGRPMFNVRTAEIRTSFERVTTQNPGYSSIFNLTTTNNGPLYLGLGNGFNTLRVHERNLDLTDKIFVPPPLELGNVPDGQTNPRKHGWFTKEILNYNDDNK